jgi:hypothetical protein
MPTIKRTEFDRLVRDFKFTELFNELGWNNAALSREIKIEEHRFPLRSIAEKSGFFVMHCETDTVPALPVRRQINTVFSKVKDFHLIIYSDKARSEQRWQFVLRAPNRPAKNIEVGWKKGQDTEALWQRTQGLFFSLDEEDNITIVDVTTRVTEAFGANAEKVTKKFYDTFKTEHRQFLAFIQGIRTQVDKEWYASLMLNRLMFCYFIQKKGFLDNNLNYLSEKLAQTREHRGSNQFYSFYRDFLLVLFHQGLNEPHQKQEIRAEIGQIPYLNGGLFDVHELEEKYTIQIPDDAFEKIFRFFDQWEWHLNTQPNASAKEINPDVIGFIFEKYINDRADMGAYYTKEDITDYISKNCIIPFLFDQTERNGGRLAPCWSLAKESGDRYIFPSVRHGISWDYRQGQTLNAPLPLPPDIGDGLNTLKPGLVERRKAWNREAPPEYGLPTEWWREVVERRQRYTDLRQKIDGGEVQTINDFITLNLDIRAFAQDCLQQTDDPDFLWAFYRALRSVSVLDPTCGSGAFLFAALNILEPLYEACLDRMAAFVEAGESKKSKNFQEVLAEAADNSRHPSREYYIYKKIIVHNLYGVDLMREAVEIAKLRLFLKLMSTVQPDRRKPNLGLEPLPDVDFNLRAGNTLVGFATLEETIEAINQRDLPGGAQSRIVFGEELEVVAAVREKAELIGMAYKRFKDSQLLTNDGSAGLKKAKDELNRRLRDLSATLDEYLAFQYGVDGAKDKQKFQNWKISHTPFHWWAEFYEVLYDEEGRFKGFDVVIGNPPYLEINQVDYKILGMRTLESGAVHNMCVERSLKISNPKGCLSMIVPMALVCTQRMAVMQQLLEQNRGCWYANFAWRPGKLFDEVNRALTIFVCNPHPGKAVFTTPYIKWVSETRSLLFQSMNYTSYSINRSAFWIPKLTGATDQSILKKILSQKKSFKELKGKSGGRIYYRSTGGLYWKVFTDFAPKFFVNGKEGSSSRETWFSVSKEGEEKPMAAILSSNLFWWWYTIASNLRDLNPSDIDGFFIPEGVSEDKKLAELGEKYLQSLVENSSMLTRIQKQTGETQTQSFKISLSKPIIDEIDTVLAEHYGFTEEELDFIINYDIKYRMGRGSGEEE